MLNKHQGFLFVLLLCSFTYLFNNIENLLCARTVLDAGNMVLNAMGRMLLALKKGSH